MRAFRIVTGFFIAFAAVVMLASPSQAATHVWVTIGPPSSAATTGATFTTNLTISSWNGVVGALDLTIHYDPSVLHIVDFSTPSDSPFYTNLAVDSDSYTSGETNERFGSMGDTNNGGCTGLGGGWYARHDYEYYY